MDLVQSLQQVHSCLEIQCFSFLSGHIWDESKLQAFPIQQPSELCHPFFCQNRAGNLQDFDIIDFQDLFNSCFITWRLIIDPQDNVFLEGDWRCNLPESHNIVTIIGLDLFYHEVSKRSKQNLPLFRVKWKPTNILSIDWVDDKQCTSMLFHLFLHILSINVCSCKVVPVKTLIFFVKMTQPKVLQPEVAKLIVIFQGMHINV